jgi:AraC-like DNA-binding protein
MPESAEPQPGWRILHATARRHSWKGEGWLSIKSFPAGRAHYSVGPGLHAVDQDSYLILNHGTTYRIEVESRVAVESFCVFFEPKFAASAFHLMDAEVNGSAAVEFFEKKYPHDELVTPLLRRLRRAHRELTAGALDEEMHRLLMAMLRAHGLAVAKADELPNIRVSARQELYRRAGRARDFADAMFREPLSLREIARAAALSPSHLLRVFAQVYGVTPHQFVIARRLQEAERLLKQTEMSVTEICFEVGFESVGSFSSLFHRKVGVSPSGFRAAKK